MAGDELLRGRPEDGASAGKAFGAVAVFRIGEEWGFVAPVRPSSNCDGLAEVRQWSARHGDGSDDDGAAMTRQRRGGDNARGVSGRPVAPAQQ